MRELKEELVGKCKGRCGVYVMYRNMLRIRSIGLDWNATL